MTQSYVFTAVVVFFGLTQHALSSDSWNYDRSDLLLGPSAWATNFPTCGGARNSPINFDKKDTVKQAAEDWNLQGWTTLNRFEIIDEVFNLKWTLDDGREVVTSGGGLGSNYNLVQFHLHWGADNKRGSEHTVNGKSYPMEMHLVHRRNDFPTATAAVISDEPNALAVLGFFFKIQEKDNPLLAPLIRGVKRVRRSTNSETQCYIYNLLQMVRNQMQGDFYRYLGGLTTPACNEVALWTVFTEAIPISKQQMNLIRTENPAAIGGDFFRDPVPLNGRTVIRFQADKKASNVNVCGKSTLYGSRALCKALPRGKGH